LTNAGQHGRQLNRGAAMHDLEQLAADAAVQLSPVKMPPSRPGGRPLVFYFVKNHAGTLLNDGEALDGGELAEWLRARINPETSTGARGKCQAG